MGNLHLVTGYAGEAHITADDQGSLNAAVFGEGQFVLKRGNKLSASIVTNNKIKVLDGDILMQGRHIRLNNGTYVELAIENGAQGYNRRDLIVARYTKNPSTGVEDCNLIVIKGTATTGTASDPEYTIGDIISGNALQNDMPLYRVPINGLNVQNLVPLFAVVDKTLGEKEKQELSAPLPIANGGTGAANGATGLKNLFAAGNTVLSSYQYGASLPTAGTKGRIFFKKV